MLGKEENNFFKPVVVIIADTTEELLPKPVIELKKISDCISDWISIIDLDYNYDLYAK